MSDIVASSEPLEPGLVAIPARPAEPKRTGTYGQILKSSALIGGSTVVNIGLGIARTKAMAILLGPAGIGLMGIYDSIGNLAGTLAGMGINTSGVRQIADAVRTGDTERIARTVITLRRVAFVLGALGALLLVAFCRPLARMSFGDYRLAGAVALMGLVVFFGAVSNGQIALVQGMRRIGDLARAKVLGGVCGTVCSIGIIYWLKKDGIVPSLICVAAMGIATSWWYSRKIQVQPVAMRMAEVSQEASALLKLGFVFMANGFMSVGVAYLIRIIVLRRIGEDAAGFYQSAWTLGGLYVGFILQAMAADFLPRLTAVAHDHAECNRLVNEQAEVGLLLAGPGVLGTLTFAPLVIQLFYSAKFGPAVEVLRWISLGMILQVASWPMGFILGAKGAQQPIFWSEVAAYASQLGLTWLGVLAFDLNGTGIGFFGSYVFYWFLIYGIARSMSGFRWSAANKKIGLLITLSVAPIFVGWYFLPHALVGACGTLVTFGVGVYCLRTLCTLVAVERIPRRAYRLLKLLRLAPAAATPRSESSP